MKKGWTYILLAVITCLLFVLAGCGGGGGGGNNGGGGGGGQPVVRSVSVGKTVLTLDAKQEYSLIASWTGIGVLDIQAMFNSLSGDTNMADISVSADKKTGFVAPKVTSGKFDLNASSSHPVGAAPPDPQAGKPESFIVPVVINPTTIHGPGPSLSMPLGGSTTLYFYADTSRGNAMTVSLRPISSRALRLVPVTCTDPGGLVTFSPNPSSITTAPVFTATGTGTTTVTATAIGGNGSPIPSLNYAIATTIVAKPTVTITSPIEGAVVSGTVPVTVSTTNATATSYTVDGGTTATLFTGNTYQWDTTQLTNATHTFTVWASGLAGQVSATRTCKVDNITPPYDPGKPAKLVLTGEVFDTNKSGTGTQFKQVYKVQDNRFCVLYADAIRFLDGQGNIVSSSSPLPDSCNAMAVVPNTSEWAPFWNAQKIVIYGPTGQTIPPPITVSGMKLARYDQYLNRVLVSGDTGLWKYDQNKPSSPPTQMLSNFVGAVCSDGHFLFYVGPTAQGTRIYKVLVSNPSGASVDFGDANGVSSINTIDGFDIVFTTNVVSKTVNWYTKDGTWKGSLQLPGNDIPVSTAGDLTITDGTQGYLSGGTSLNAFRFKIVAL